MGSGQEYIGKGGSVETAQRVGRVVRQQCYPALCMPPSLWKEPCSAVTEAGRLSGGVDWQKHSSGKDGGAGKLRNKSCR